MCLLTLSLLKNRSVYLCLHETNALLGSFVEFEWSPEVSIIQDNELFLRVPYYGDVKIIILNTACTTFLTIESASQVRFTITISAYVLSTNTGCNVSGLIKKTTILRFIQF